MFDDPARADARSIDHPAPAGRALRDPATVGSTVQAVAMAAAVGSAVIHFALAPMHLDEQTTHGVFFFVVAWAQVAVVLAIGRWGQVAAALEFGRWRDRTEPWLAAAVLNSSVLLVWLASRTIGVPETAHSSLGSPDILAAMLEVAVIVAALVAVRSSLVGRPVPSLVANPLALGVLGVTLAGAVSSSLAP
jgi:hypothetical protein